MKVYNTTDSPVLVDGDGRTLAGRESDDLDVTEQVQDALDAGQLVAVDDPDAPADASTSKPTRRRSAGQES